MAATIAKTWTVEVPTAGPITIDSDTVHDVIRDHCEYLSQGCSKRAYQLADLPYVIKQGYGITDECEAYRAAAKHGHAWRLARIYAAGTDWAVQEMVRPVVDYFGYSGAPAEVGEFQRAMRALGYGDLHYGNIGWDQHGYLVLLDYEYYGER